jgi:hypothetical protein
MNNPLFKDSYNNWISEFSEEFKNRCLFYQLKNNLTGILAKVPKNNLRYINFLKKRNSHNRFNNIIKFYTDYIVDAINRYGEPNISYGINMSEIFGDNYIDWLSEFFDSIFYEYLEKIFKKWFISLSDLQKLKNFKKINFDILKKDIFLDYSKDEDKIYINIEYIFAYISTCDLNKIKEENYLYYTELSSIAQLFLDTDTTNTLLVNTITNLFSNILWWKYTKWDIFFLIIYNKLYNFNYVEVEKNIESFLKDKDTILQRWFLKKKILNRYNIINNNLFSDTSFIKLWMNNVVFIPDFWYWLEFMFERGFYDAFVNNWINEIQIVDNIWNLEVINNEASQVLLEDYRVDIIREFWLNKNINKKNIKYTQKKLIDHKSLRWIIEKWLKWSIKYLFDWCDDISFHYIFLLPLYKASKRFINANFHYEDSYAYKDNDIDLFLKTINKYRDKYLEIESFIDYAFEENMWFYWLFSWMKSRYMDKIWRKLPEDEIDFLIWERELFKRLLIYLSDLGFVELAWNNISKKVCYYSWDWWYGWSYSLSEKYEEIKYFDIKYIKFNDIKLEKNIPKDNYISWNDIYLSLDIPKRKIEAFSKFCILDKIENYAVLNINRDVLIKAKNEYNITAKGIISELKSLKINISKNLEILIDSIDKQKTDLNILPSWIPIILENSWIFNEFLKLKLFNKYILYSNENLRLIIFDEKFKWLEKVLNNRNILYKFEKK